MPDDVRTRLIEITASLLSEEGPSALTTRRLARAADTSTMAVYTHFGGLPELVREVVREAFRRLAQHMSDLPSSDDPMEHLVSLAQAYRDNAHENPHLYAVMFGNASLGGFRLTPEELEEGRYTFDVLVDAVRAAMDAGALGDDDPKALAGQLWSALHGYITLELGGYFAADDEQEIMAPMLRKLAL